VERRRREGRESDDQKGARPRRLRGCRVPAEDAGEQPSCVLHPQATAALREHRRAQNEERLAAGSAWSDLEFVFTDEIGASLHPDRVTKFFVQHAREAGMPKIRLHDLRHTVATLALTAGVHAKVVQELLGHANVAITLDTYSHVAPELHEQAALAIGGLVFGKTAKPRRSSPGRGGAVSQLRFEDAE
jgi:integrase